MIEVFAAVSPSKSQASPNCPAALALCSPGRANLAELLRSLPEATLLLARCPAFCLNADRVRCPSNVEACHVSRSTGGDRRGGCRCLSGISQPLNSFHSANRQLASARGVIDANTYVAQSRGRDCAADIAPSVWYPALPFGIFSKTTAQRPRWRPPCGCIRLHCTRHCDVFGDCHACAHRHNSSVEWALFGRRLQICSSDERQPFAPAWSLWLHEPFDNVGDKMPCCTQYPEPSSGVPHRH